MKETEPESKNLRMILIKNKWLVLAVLLLIAGFYWFQIRPAQIKSECTSSSRESAKKVWEEADSDSDFTGDQINDGKISRSSAERIEERRDRNYQYCLHSKGL